MKRTRPRRKTCGDKRGTTAGVRRHQRAGEHTCHPCYRADHERQGYKTDPLTPRQLRRTRRAKRKKRSPEWERGYSAGFNAARRKTG